MGIEDFGGGQNPQADVLVVTTNDVPGYRVQQVIGEVFGLTVRSRHLGSQIGAGLKSMVGGELKGLTKTLVETRNQAMERLVEQARARGANAVLMFRFDVTEAMDGAAEVCAYGTAAVIAQEPMV
ncbi:YbjQ family protein [Streptomyces longispororuber]|uniref:YbjQ family protein n=1 Tax=Streptomyces longispororuber TaxID=68230 RepID=UPI002108A034|nr:YbjQ family protein [Streptomyces longispororuber]MCQ4213072.1 YbjQ family protein [Streptomyces longispororuber]